MIKGCRLAKRHERFHASCWLNSRKQNSNEHGPADHASDGVGMKLRRKGKSWLRRSHLFIKHNETWEKAWVRIPERLQDSCAWGMIPPLWSRITAVCMMKVMSGGVASWSWLLIKSKKERVMKSSSLNLFSFVEKKSRRRRLCSCRQSSPSISSDTTWEKKQEDDALENEREREREKNGSYLSV